MVIRSSYAARRFILSSFFTLILACSLSGLMVCGKIETIRHSNGLAAVSFLHDDDEGSKKGLTREQRTLEARIWHEANLQSPVQIESPELASEVVVNQDINDIAVIQGDSRIVAPPRFFDLNVRAVTFTPSGGSVGYTINTASSLFDNNLGAKRDLTTTPAVNPNTTAEPGDDAYLIEDLGFNFTFYGANYSSVAVTSNGNLVFRPLGIGQAEFDNGAIFATASLAEFQSGLPRIAPYWHDLDARQVVTSGTNGIFVRKSSDRVVITWNNVRDFPNNPSTDNGIHRFQVTLFSNGRIVFTYDAAQLTSKALVGISPGQTSNIPTLIDLTAPPADAVFTPVGEFFSTSTRLDYIAAVKSFYAARPGRDVYDFAYVMTDFNFDLGGAFAFYHPIRNDVAGIGLPQEDSDTTAVYGSRKIQGILNLSNIVESYPAFPTTRFLGANHGLSIMGQEQGHRWLSYVKYPGNDHLLLGRDNAHWSFFFNAESTISSPAARRSSSVEGNVWNDNGNGTFTSVSLVDGFSRLDQYLMGLRPASEVPDTFVITNPTGSGRTREAEPRPGVTTNGTKQTIAINQIIQANNARTPNSNTAQKDFRAAVILVVRQGTQPSEATLNKVALYRLAWESYFGQATDFLGSLNMGLADQRTSREIVAVSAASYKSTLAPGEIATLFGSEMASGFAAAPSSPLPTTLANTQVRINGVPAPLFFVSPSQINFQAPRATTAVTANPPVSSATALIEVISNGQLIRAGTFQIAPTAPAIFTRDQTGGGPAEAIDAIRGGGEPFNAKQPNGLPTLIALFGTGLGADATDVGGDVSSSMRATIDGNPVSVGYAGRAPGFTGLNQINIMFPAIITSGTHNLVISRNGIPSRQVTITVR